MSQTPIIDESNPISPPRSIREIIDDRFEEVWRRLYDDSNTVALIATLLTAVEAQVLAITLADDRKNSAIYSLFNAPIMAAMLLSTVACLNACRRAHWLTFAHRDALRLVIHRYLYLTGDVRVDVPSPVEVTVAAKPNVFDYIKAFSFSRCFTLVVCGFYLFIVGFYIYVASRFSNGVIAVGVIVLVFAICVEIANSLGRISPAIHHIHFDRIDRVDLGPRDYLKDEVN
ncbi:uncharacterized protein EI90DRAFT_3067686 [Cantharellus anzutake]|uniref:uncharacterized protein n=1 Tax=Cantharellus anzutake TaxID=1750568 RepID=UPI001908B3AF|nr:uncharacterized protein EI90DRAFT_3067686 [Cantharellus anzutake]KAF8327423.1 hypothetical protein EI90DRAFT_3067686 [Cantharellus anzutake]